MGRPTTSLDRRHQASTRAPLLLLFTLLLTPSASAQFVPEQVPSVWHRTISEPIACNVDFSPPCMNMDTEYFVFTVWRWKLPANVPDQINGSGIIWRPLINGTAAHIEPQPPATPVTGRPGWMQMTVIESFDVDAPWQPHSIYGTTCDPGNMSCPDLGPGPESCRFLPIVTQTILFPYDINLIRGCGENIEPPAGFGVRTLTQANATQQLNVSVRVTMSPGDAGNATNVVADNSSYNYTLWRVQRIGFIELPTWQNTTSRVVRSEREFEATHLRIGASPDALLSETLFAIAFDNRTYQLARSCQATGSVGLTTQTWGCGNTTLGDAPNVIGIPTSPIIPFLNVTQAAQRMGVSETFIGLLWGLGLFTILSVIGFVVAGTLGVAVFGSLTLALLAILGVVPLWIIILVFLIGAALAAVKLQGGST